MYLLIYFTGLSPFSSNSDKPFPVAQVATAVAVPVAVLAVVTCLVCVVGVRKGNSKRHKIHPSQAGTSDKPLQAETSNKSSQAETRNKTVNHQEV